MLTLTPAYGRDYKTQKEAKEAFLSGKDWIVANLFHAYDGKPCNLEDLQHEGKETKVMLRFCRLTKIVCVDIPKAKAKAKSRMDLVDAPCDPSTDYYDTHDKPQE
jgi:hypothetical protein